MILTAITFAEFCSETAGLKCVSGGEMFSGGTFSEYGNSDERCATHRYERAADGSETWFRIS